MSAIAERQRRILEVVQTRGACTYADLEKLLGVSSMTVRRDIDALAGREALIKTLGGAQYSQVPQFLHETALSTRISVNLPEKAAIAAAAIGLVRDAQTVFLDGSTTCIALARLLARSPLTFTAITNSSLIALELGVSKTAKVICTSGEYDSQSACFVGPLAEEACGCFFEDVAFMSTKALAADDGTYESSMGTLRIKQLVAKRAGRLVLLVDSAKFGQRALCRVLAIDSIHTIITDSGCPQSALGILRRTGRQIVVVPVLGGTR
jgi:DeoR/GlpR family transcriptional regulator of sugar metabolism